MPKSGKSRKGKRQSNNDKLDAAKKKRGPKYSPNPNKRIEIDLEMTKKDIQKTVNEISEGYDKKMSRKDASNLYAYLSKQIQTSYRQGAETTEISELIDSMQDSIRLKVKLENGTLRLKGKENYLTHFSDRSKSDYDSDTATSIKSGYETPQRVESLDDGDSSSSDAGGAGGAAGGEERKSQNSKQDYEKDFALFKQDSEELLKNLTKNSHIIKEDTVTDILVEYIQRAEDLGKNPFSDKDEIKKYVGKILDVDLDGEAGSFDAERYMGSLQNRRAAGTVERALPPIPTQPVVNQDLFQMTKRNPLTSLPELYPEDPGFTHGGFTSGFRHDGSDPFYLQTLENMKNFDSKGELIQDIKEDFDEYEEEIRMLGLDASDVPGENIVGGSGDVINDSRRDLIDSEDMRDFVDRYGTFGDRKEDIRRYDLAAGILAAGDYNELDDLVLDTVNDDWKESYSRAIANPGNARSEMNMIRMDRVRRNRKNKDTGMNLLMNQNREKLGRVVVDVDRNRMGVGGLSDKIDEMSGGSTKAIRASKDQYKRPTPSHRTSQVGLVRQSAGNHLRSVTELLPTV